MVPMEPDIRKWVDSKGNCPFDIWFNGLASKAAAKVTIAIERLRAGNTGNLKALGDGVHELKIDWGPGYRVYFGRRGATLVVLVGGGDKHRQRSDIAAAKSRWSEYVSSLRASADEGDGEPWR